MSKNSSSMNFSRTLNHGKANTAAKMYLRQPEPSNKSCTSFSLFVSKEYVDGPIHYLLSVLLLSSWLLLLELTRQNNRTTSAPLPTNPGHHSMETDRSTQHTVITYCVINDDKDNVMHGLIHHSQRQLTFNNIFFCEDGNITMNRWRLLPLKIIEKWTMFLLIH